MATNLILPSKVSSATLAGPALGRDVVRFCVVLVMYPVMTVELLVIRSDKDADLTRSAFELAIVYAVEVFAAR